MPAMTNTGKSFERIVGHYAGQGVTCPQFAMDSGETVSLSGVTVSDMENFANAKLTLEGTWWQMSTCMQGRDFHVESITNLN
jgi:hypothetical protein